MALRSCAAALALLEMNRTGLICINITMSTAMEVQRPAEHVEWSEAIVRLERLGISRDNIFTASRSIGFVLSNLPDIAYFDPQLELQLTVRIHEILWPNIEFTWPEYRHKKTSDL
jgi:hypothetical protein